MLPIEMHQYHQFMWRWIIVNERRCFSVCFTV